MSSESEGTRQIADKEYDRAISLLTYHTNLLWEEYGAFLLAETVLIGFLGTTLSQAKTIVGPNVLLFLGAVFGLFTAILWYATYSHNYTHYRLCILQARRHETALGINMLTEGNALSSGSVVTIDDESLRLSLLARHLPPRRSVPSLIWLFGFAYLGLMYVTWPWRS